ncbi:MAG: glycoside hydrolase family 2 [Clostridia bacterium]|nr:glycoside hydrolase family 2 [Clostridia bacterium]
MSNLQPLYTAAGEALSGTPWEVYPRPQLRRDSFLCLNGDWEFAVSEVEPTAYDRTIRVPFPPESLLSGVGECFPEEAARWYRRQFTLPTGFCKERVLLHIGAADQEAAVYINGVLVGEHVGGYEPFCFDITDSLQAENTIVIRVIDRLSAQILPYGKQCHQRGGMWYTPVSGIWQTVWLESVADAYVRRLTIDTDADSVTITADGVTDGTVTVQTPQGTVEVALTDGAARITLTEPRRWSPEDPYLYEFALTTPTDEVHSYFALRTLDIRTVDGLPRLCLNGKPYFFHGLLDQGYWSDGLFTPATPECYEQDILAMKALGFNTLRKHIKLEPEQFYYDCDRLGMIVFQDMVNNSDYAFVRDTALPTVGVIRRNDTRLHRDPVSRAAFVRGMEQTVRQLYNHPCICCWTIFNEGWGQFCGSEQYHHLRALDGSRFIDTTSGWFLGSDSDVDSRHIYFRRLKMKSSDKPMVLSEFGGYSWKAEGHVFNTEQSYGYGSCKTREELADKLRALYTEQVLPLIPQGLCAAIYTQVSDIEDEINGLLTYDRRVAKLLPEEFADISKRLCGSI